MVKRLKYGLIGAGMMGQEHIRNIALLDQVEVTAIYEPNETMRRAALATCTAEAAPSFEALLDTAELDALVIASPNFEHAGQFEMIARRTPRPLLIEKPLFTDPADAGRIDELARRYDAPVWVAMEYRYMPPIARLLAEADAVTGGVKMLTIREHRFPFLRKVGNWNRFNRYSGGTLVEKCCHFFDLMRLILKAEPVRVMASAGQVVNHLGEEYAGEVPDIWDSGYVIVDFDGGQRAMLELCMFAEGSEFQEEIAVVGPAGKLECRVPGPTRLWPEHLGPPPVAELVRSPRNPPGATREKIEVDPALLTAGDHNGATFYQHERFANVVRDGGTPDVTISDGAKAVAMGLAAQRSAEAGAVVDL